jgi:hypothetical protein
VVVTLALLAASGSARAYVLTRSDGGAAVRWPNRCIVMQPDARADAADDAIDPDTIDTTLARAVQNWNSRLMTCSYMVLGQVPATRALEPVSDGRPSVVFRTDFWGRDGMAYDQAAIGVTTVWFANRPGDPADGQISDADIELNAINFTLTIDPTNAVARPNTMVADLENALTHELGHVLGLAHTCWDHKTMLPPVDNTGAAIPDCSSQNLPMTITQSTMFPYAGPKAINMRIVDDDTLAGICMGYPNNTEPLPACYGLIDGPGCAVPRAVPHSVPSLRALVMAVAVGLVAWLVRRRRRRRDIL